MRRNETLKNLSRETVKRASVHEMLFSFCATYSPELPLCFSMKPVRRARPVFAPDTHTLAAHPSYLAMCNGLRVTPWRKQVGRNLDCLHALLLLPDVLRWFFPRAIKEKATLLLANDRERAWRKFHLDCHLFNYGITKLLARVALHAPVPEKYRARHVA